MSLAQKLRDEKRKSVVYTPIEFLKHVEEYFKNNEYNSIITIEGLIVKEKPFLSIDGGRIIDIPIENFYEYMQLLHDEGFYLYEANSYTFKVSLFAAEYITETGTGVKFNRIWFK